jgi:hypothetical protein
VKYVQPWCVIWPELSYSACCCSRQRRVHAVRSQPPCLSLFIDRPRKQNRFVIFNSADHTRWRFLRNTSCGCHRKRCIFTDRHFIFKTFVDALRLTNVCLDQWVSNFFSSRRTVKHIQIFWRTLCTKLKIY